MGEPSAYRYYVDTEGLKSSLRLAVETEAAG